MFKYLTIVFLLLNITMAQDKEEEFIIENLEMLENLELLESDIELEVLEVLQQENMVDKNEK